MGQTLKKIFSKYDRIIASENRVWLDFLLFFVALAATFIMIRKIDTIALFEERIVNQQESLLLDVILTLAVASLYLVILIFLRHYYFIGQIAQANKDSLVGIFNRGKGSELLREEIQRANLYRVPLSIIMFDIDDFKLINDKYGHDCGDNVLKDVIKLAQKHSRRSDILIRWGGEEFVIGCCSTQIDAANKMADRIRFAIEQHVFPMQLKVTASFGATQYHLCEEMEDMIKRADELLYKSKNTGKNKVWSSDFVDDKELQLQ
jgi:diguanylate cyclase (GGDEF)-like protein